MVTKYSSFKKFPEFAGIIYRNRYCEQKIYIDVLRRFWDAIRRKHREKWKTNSWFLLHDNAPAHRSVLVNDFLAKNNITVLWHPPSSPNLAAAVFYLFLPVPSTEINIERTALL